MNIVKYLPVLIGSGRKNVTVFLCLKENMENGAKTEGILWIVRSLTGVAALC